MSNLWSIILNVFLNATKKSFKRMLNIAEHHDSALFGKKSDPFFLTLYNRFHGLYTNYIEKYEKWTTIKGTLKGETSKVKSYFKELAQKLLAWDVKVQVVYLKNTDEYLAIFPTGKRLFYLGTYMERINELSSLINRLNDITELKALQTEIKAFYDIISAELTKHHAKKTAIKDASEELEQARVAVGNIMYANLGLLMDHHYENIEHIEHFFPLSLLRKKKNSKEKQETNVYAVHVVENERKEAGISFTSTTKFSFYINGNAAVGIYTGGSIDAPPTEPKFIIQPDETKECNAFELGDATNRYLFIVNLSDTEESDVEISLI